MKVRLLENALLYLRSVQNNKKSTRFIDSLQCVLYYEVIYLSLLLKK